MTGGVVAARDQRDVDDVGDHPDGEARREHAHRPPHLPGRAGDRDQDRELHQVEHRVEQPQGARRIGQLGGGDAPEHQHPADRHQGQRDDHPVQQRPGPPNGGPWRGGRAEQRGGAGEDAGREDRPDQRGVWQVAAAEPLHRPDRPAECGERHGDRQQRPEPAQRGRMTADHPGAGDGGPAGDQQPTQVADQRGAGQCGNQPERLQENDRSHSGQPSASRPGRRDGSGRPGGRRPWGRRQQGRFGEGRRHAVRLGRGGLPRSLLHVLSRHGRSGSSSCVHPRRT